MKEIHEFIIIKSTLVMNIPFLQEILNQIFNICSAETKSNTFSFKTKAIWYFQTQYKSTPQ